MSCTTRIQQVLRDGPLRVLERPLRPALLVIAIALLSAAPGHAKEPEPSFMQKLYPPELVMQNQRAIGLQDEQREAITTAIQQTQSATVELSWTMQDAASRLTDEMSKPRIDENTALAAAEEMMTIEGKVKRAHLGLLIRIKNTLDPEQQRKLDSIRGQSR